MTDRDRTDAEPRAGSDAGDESTGRMRDVSHTPPHGEGTNGVWSRGDEAARPDERTDR
ncbi:hypothetical protein [Haloplanus halophilus]|uniref:hypothetical protein n=1 Tax=Haloplanus halophilus TaxID=2949993 RepID=UPI0020418AAE|nr:hypothetical protein [Haloplanus sp. GDY1]